MANAWRNFKNIFSRPLFAIIFMPEMLKFHPYSILNGNTRVEFIIWSSDFLQRSTQKFAQSSSCFVQLLTLYNELLRIARNLLETRKNIKIESRSFYHIICGWFSWGSSKFIFSLKKKIQNGWFSKSPILKKNLWKFHALT